MKILKKAGLYLTLLSLPYLVGCSNLEDKRQDVLKEFKESPRYYERDIDSLINELYKIKIQANKGHNVKPGYVNPSDLSFIYSKSGEGDYLMIRNSNTNETLELRYIDGTTQLGNFKHRLSGLKKEISRKLFDNSESLLTKIDKISGEGKNLLFILDNGGF
ncbi:MAG: hypothetical protein PHG05_03415 [Candidatus Nanoarchaeia archaeon]|nr:hypothetical protein [Candidatus Nanoarchaeia archaeon]